MTVPLLTILLDGPRVGLGPIENVLILGRIPGELKLPRPSRSVVVLPLGLSSLERACTPSCIAPNGLPSVPLPAGAGDLPSN